MQKGLIECSFTDILRKDDYNVLDGDTVTSDSNYKLKATDLVKLSYSFFNDMLHAFAH